MTRLYNMYFNMMSNLKNKRGQGMVEYVLIIGLIAILVITALSPLGTAIAAKFRVLTTQVTGAGVPAP